MVILPLIFKHSSPLNCQFSKVWFYLVPISTDFGKVWAKVQMQVLKHITKNQYIHCWWIPKKQYAYCFITDLRGGISPLGPMMPLKSTFRVWAQVSNLVFYLYQVGTWVLLINILTNKPVNKPTTVIQSMLLAQWVKTWKECLWTEDYRYQHALSSHALLLFKISYCTRSYIVCWNVFQLMQIKSSLPYHPRQDKTELL